MDERGGWQGLDGILGHRTGNRLFFWSQTHGLQSLSNRMWDAKTCTLTARGTAETILLSSRLLDTQPISCRILVSKGPVTSSSQVSLVPERSAASRALAWKSTRSLQSSTSFTPFVRSWLRLRPPSCITISFRRMAVRSHRGTNRTLCALYVLRHLADDAMRIGLQLNGIDNPVSVAGRSELHIP